MAFRRTRRVSRRTYGRASTIRRSGTRRRYSSSGRRTTGRRTAGRASGGSRNVVRIEIVQPGAQGVATPFMQEGRMVQAARARTAQF